MRMNLITSWLEKCSLRGSFKLSPCSVLTSTTYRILQCVSLVLECRRWRSPPCSVDGLKTKGPLEHWYMRAAFFLALLPQCAYECHWRSVQWKSTCPAHARLWVHSPESQKHLCLLHIPPSVAFQEWVLGRGTRVGWINRGQVPTKHWCV